MTIKESCSDIQMKPCNFSKQRMIGQGGFGKVFRANFQSTLVVIKKFPIGYMDPNEMANAEKTLRLIRHPHLVAVLGIVDNLQEAEVCIVMESVSGCNLRPYCSGTREMGYNDKIEVATQCFSALAYLHSMKITHGYMSPENILVDTDQNEGVVAKICDFGQKVFKEKIDFNQVTQIFQNRMYLAPEAVHEECNAEAADVYSLGVVMCEMFSGMSFWQTASGEDPNEYTILKKLQELDDASNMKVAFNNSKTRDITPAALLELTECCTVAVQLILQNAVHFNFAERPSAADTYIRLQLHSLINMLEL